MRTGEDDEDVLMVCRVDEGLKRLAESAEDFTKISEKIPKLHLELDF